MRWDRHTIHSPLDPLSTTPMKGNYASPMQCLGTLFGMSKVEGVGMVFRVTHIHPTDVVPPPNWASGIALPAMVPLAAQGPHGRKPMADDELRTTQPAVHHSTEPMSRSHPSGSCAPSGRAEPRSEHLGWGPRCDSMVCRRKLPGIHCPPSVQPKDWDENFAATPTFFHVGLIVS